MAEEEHRMAAYHLNKARGNVIERKDYRRALEHAEKAIAFLKRLDSLEETEGVDKTRGRV